jgi:hypothetical protein
MTHVKTWVIFLVCFGGLSRRLTNGVR